MKIQGLGKSFETGKAIINEMKSKVHVRAKAVSAHANNIAKTSMMMIFKPHTWAQKKYGEVKEDLFNKGWTYAFNDKKAQHSPHTVDGITYKVIKNLII